MAAFCLACVKCKARENKQHQPPSVPIFTLGKLRCSQLARSLQNLMDLLSETAWIGGALDELGKVLVCSFVCWFMLPSHTAMPVAAEGTAGLLCALGVNT